jgi:hypothetical protein
MKKSELTKMIGEIIKEVISEQSSKLKLRTLTEGQFSWMTQDTGEQIGSQDENQIPVYMFDDKGKYYYENDYEGYGVFGGKDYYELLDQMNGGSGDRSRGIRLAFNKIKIDSEVLFPALVTNPNFNWKSHDFTQQPENDPNQSWYMEPEEDDDDVSGDWDEDEDEDEDEIYESKKQFKSLKNNKKTSKMNEASKSNPVIDNLLKVINTKKAGPEYKKALMDLIAMAEKKSGKTVNTKKEALLALDYSESSIKESNTMKKSELTKMIQEVIKEVISEQYTNKVNEAYVPSNIKEFAKRKGASALVNKVATWAEKCGKGIRGGTAIGKNYSTLVLDLGYQDGAIHINLDDQTVDLYGEEVFDVKSFKMALDNNANEIVNEAVIDTEKAFRLVAKGDRDAALETLKTEVNKIINSNKEYSDTKVSYILSKGNPKDIIIKLNGLGARVISGMISMKTPAIKNNFDKVSTYKPQLTKIS